MDPVFVGVVAVLPVSLFAPGSLDDRHVPVADTGFFLNGNTVRRGSNIIIYGNNAKVTHSGGGVANGGGVGPPQGGHGGGNTGGGGGTSGGGGGGGGGSTGGGSTGGGSKTGKTGKVTTGGSGAGGGGGKGGKVKSAGGVWRVRAVLQRSAWQCVAEIVRCSTCLLLDRKRTGPLSRLPAVGSRMLFSFHVSVVLG